MTGSPAGPQSNQNVWVLPPISRNAVADQHEREQKSTYAATRNSPFRNGARGNTSYLIVTIICEYKILRFWYYDDFADTNFCDFIKSS